MQGLEKKEIDFAWFFLSLNDMQAIIRPISSQCKHHFTSFTLCIDVIRSIILFIWRSYHFFCIFSRLDTLPDWLAYASMVKILDIHFKDQYIDNVSDTTRHLCFVMLLFKVIWLKFDAGFTDDQLCFFWRLKQSFTRKKNFYLPVLFPLPRMLWQYQNLLKMKWNL